MMGEHGGAARDHPADQLHARGDHRRGRADTGEHTEPVGSDGDPRVQQGVPVDHQQHIPHHVDQGGDAEHQHADEGRGADDLRGRPRLRGCCRGGGRLLDAVGQTPARYDGVARRGPERTAAASGRRRCAGPHRYPAVAGRQPRRRALPSRRRRGTSLRRCAGRTPPRVGRGAILGGRHQGPAAAGTPFALSIAHVPARAALGAHLDHRTRLTPSRRGPRNAGRGPRGDPRSTTVRAGLGNGPSRRRLSTVSTGLSTTR